MPLSSKIAKIQDCYGALLKARFEAVFIKSMCRSIHFFESASGPRTQPPLGTRTPTRCRIRPLHPLAAATAVDYTAAMSEDEFLANRLAAWGPIRYGAPGVCRPELRTRKAAG